VATSALAQLRAPIPDITLRAIDKIIAAVGSKDMNASLADAINLIAKADRVYAFERKLDVKPILYSSWTRKGRLDEIVADYREHYYKTDPMNSVLRRAPNMLASLRLKREDVPDLDYRRTCFDEPEICERLTIMRKIGDRWGVLNLSRTYASGYYQRHEVEQFTAFAQVALPLLARHDQLVRILKEFGSSPLSIDEVERRFARRFPILTARERQVCARTMLGMTAEAIATELLIGRATVLTYRLRAYARLGIRSPYQLSTLVLN
jgi:DNA-binding CsgD family transcriptional regulator